MLFVGCLPAEHHAPPVPVEQLVARHRDAVCAKDVRCGVFASEQSCEDYFSYWPGDEPAIPAAVTIGSIVYDPQAAGDCLEAIANESCDPSREDVRVTPDACVLMLRAQRHATMSCMIDEECVSGACLHDGFQSSCPVGHCGASSPPPPPSPRILEGGFCNGDSDCDYGLVCEFADAGPSVCTKTPALGEPCLVNRNSCIVAGLTCDATTRLCTTLRGEGESCSISGPVCRADLACDPDSHTCVALPADGQECDLGACAGTDRCGYDPMNGIYTCSAPKPDGADCTSSVQCASSYCTGPAPSDTCEPWPVCE